MPNVCSVVFCKVGYQQRKNKQRSIPENYPVFSFPFKKPDLLNRWVKFCNRKNWTPSKNGGICAKHFEKNYLKMGIRTTLHWKLNPIPSIYPADVSSIPPSMLPTVTTRRKSPTRRELPDEFEEFRKKDEIKSFSQINESFCPPGFLLQVQQDKAVFYKLENCPKNGVPVVTETIIVTDSLTVKLFWKAISVPLPDWFRKGCACRLKTQSMLHNFPAYIKNFVQEKSTKLQDELHEIKYKKPEHGPKFSLDLLQFSLLLRYTSLPAYKLLKEHFPLPSLSLLSKLSKVVLLLLKLQKFYLTTKSLAKT